MIKSKLFHFLSVLKKDEMDIIKKMVYSPFFNEKKENIAFFEYLYKQYPFQDERKIEKEVIFKKVRGKTAVYDDAWMRKRMTDLFAIIKKFIYYHAETSASSQALQYVHFCETHNLIQYMEEGLKEFEQLDTLYESSESLHKHATFVEYRFRQQFATGNGRTSEVSITDIIRNNRIAAVAKELEWYCASLNNQKIYKLERADKSRLFDFEATQSDESLWNVAFIRMYFHIYNFLQSKKEKETPFNQAFECYFENKHKFSPVQNTTFAVYLLGFCYSQIAKGDKSYLETVLRIYDTMIADLSILVNSQMPMDTFVEIIRNVSRLQKWDWIAAFRQQFEPLLPEDDKQIIVDWADVIIRIRRGENEEAQQLLANIPKIKIDRMELQIRALRIINNYERFSPDERFDQLSVMIDSFRQFIYRSVDLAEQLKTRYLNFAAYFDRFLQIPDFDKPKFFRLHNEIAKDVSMFERDWLMEKIEKKTEAS